MLWQHTFVASLWLFVDSLHENDMNMIQILKWEDGFIFCLSWWHCTPSCRCLLYFVFFMVTICALLLHLISTCEFSLVFHFPEHWRIRYFHNSCSWCSLCCACTGYEHFSITSTENGDIVSWPWPFTDRGDGCYCTREPADLTCGCECGTRYAPYSWWAHSENSGYCVSYWGDRQTC